MPPADIAIRKAAPKATPYKLTDGAGLYLLVRPDGARYWRMDYRWAGKRGTLALGVYTLVSLLEAREKRDRAKKQLAAGIDLSAQQKLDKVAIATAAKNTFRLVADEWVAKLEREGRAETTLSKTKWLIDLVCFHPQGLQPR
jgi:hypothetical protein